MHLGMKSGLRTRCKCKPRQNCHSSCLVFNDNIWISSKMNGNYLESWTSTGYFSKSSGSFVMVSFLKSQTLTAYFSNPSHSFVPSNFHEVPNLNRLFLKHIQFIYNYYYSYVSTKTSTAYISNTSNSFLTSIFPQSLKPQLVISQPIISSSFN